MKTSDLQTAPLFALPDSRGVVHAIDEFLARGPLLLAFHRGTWWPNCRRQFGALADHAPEYLARGVALVAIVAQRPDAVRAYEEQHRLPFRILIDSTREVIKAYGVYHRIGIDAWNIAHPALFLIARDRHVMRSFIGGKQTEFPSHSEIMQWLDNC